MTCLAERKKKFENRYTLNFGVDEHCLLGGLEI